MKTSPNRIRRNGATKTNKSQAEKPDEFAFPKHRSFRGPFTCLAFYCRLTKKPVKKVPLSDEEILAVGNAQYTPEFKGKLPQDFVAQAIREKLAKSELAETSIELNRVVGKSNALLQLLFDSMQLRAIPGQDSAFNEEEEGEKLLFGLSCLINDTQSHLSQINNDLRVLTGAPDEAKTPID